MSPQQIIVSFFFIILRDSAKKLFTQMKNSSYINVIRRHVLYLILEDDERYNTQMTEY